MDKYSIQFDIPNVDVQSSIFYPRNPNYLIQIQKYNLPKGDDYEVSTYTLEGKVKHQKYDEVYENKGDGVVLRLILQDNNLSSIHVIKEVHIKEEVRIIKQDKCRNFHYI